MKNSICPTFKTELIPILSVVISIVLSFYFYAHFPERVATHWNIQGQIDGWSSRGFAAFFFPALNLAIYLLMLFLPLADPKKKNYQDFRLAYHWIKGALVVFMFLIYLAVGLSALGYSVAINTVVPLGIGALFVIIGLSIRNIKQNWFMGIRTPWTISSETVWAKTHRFGGWAFVAAGLLFMLTGLLSQFLWPLIVLIFLIILSTVLYSYLVYRQESKG